MKLTVLESKDKKDCKKLQKGLLEPVTESFKESTVTRVRKPIANKKRIVSEDIIAKKEDNLKHTYDGLLKDNEVYYTINVFNKKGERGEGVLIDGAEDAFDEVYFNTADEAKAYADKTHPDAEVVMVRENEWNDSLQFPWSSGPSFIRENGKWSAFDNKRKDRTVEESKKLTERRWNSVIKAGIELRDALRADSLDVERVREAIIACYDELYDKGLIDDVDYDDWTEEVRDCDFESEWGVDEDAIDYELDELYDLCDNIGAFLAVTEADLDESCKKKAIKEAKKSPKQFTFADQAKWFREIAKQADELNKLPGGKVDMGWLARQLRDAADECDEEAGVSADTKVVKESVVRDFIELVLENDETEVGGVAFKGETVKDFADEIGLSYDAPISELNEALKTCGIKEINKSITEMTDTELDQARAKVRDIQDPEERHRESEKLSCIDMINSIIAYGRDFTDGEDLVRSEEEARYNYLAPYIKELGRDAVVKLAQEQLDDIGHINKGVFTDSEGLSYNSITWKR